METPSPTQPVPTSIRLTPALEKEIEEAMEATSLSKPDVIRQALRLGLGPLLEALKSPAPQNDAA